MSKFRVVRDVYRPIIINHKDIWESDLSLEAIGLMIKLLYDPHIPNLSPDEISYRYQLSIGKSKKLIKEILSSGLVEVEEEEK